MQPHKIFETPFWHLKEELPHGAYEWALEYEKNNIGRTRSNYGGYQSDAFSMEDHPFNCLLYTSPSPRD